MKQALKAKIKEQAQTLKELKKECKIEQRKGNGSSSNQYLIHLEKKSTRTFLLMYALVRSKDLTSTDKKWEEFISKEKLEMKIEEFKKTLEKKEVSHE